MYYIKQKFNINNEVKEYNIPIASYADGVVRGFEDIASQGFKGANNVKLLGINKANLILPESNGYFPDLELQDIVIPVITEISSEDSDVTSIVQLVSRELRRMKLPLIVSEGTGYDADKQRYVPTLEDITVEDYYNRYTISSEEARELEYEAESAKLEAMLSTQLQEELISEEDADFKRAQLEEKYQEEDEVEYKTYIFSRPGESNKLSFYNLYSYEMKGAMEAFRKTIESKGGIQQIVSTLQKEDRLLVFALMSMFNTIMKSPVNIEGIVENIEINGVSRHLLLSSNPRSRVLNLMSPNTWTRQAGIVSLIDSYFTCLDYMINTRLVKFNNMELLDEDVTIEAIQKSIGISRSEIVAMIKPEDKILLPIESFTGFRKFIEFMVREDAYVVGGRNTGNESMIKRLRSLELANPFYQENYAFPYTNKDMFSEKYRELFDKDSRVLMEGLDENNDADFYDSEKELLARLIDLYTDILYYEGGEKASSMSKDDYLMYCIENKITSQLFVEYMAILSIQVANINWAHTGIYPCKPVYAWYTSKGFDDYLDGKQRIDAYKFSKKNYEGNPDNALIFSSESVRRAEALGDRTCGEYKLLQALIEATREDMLAPINMLVRISRFGSRKPTKIKLTDKLYYQPYDGNLSDISSKAESDKFRLPKGFDGILAGAVMSDITVEDANIRGKYSLPAKSHKFPLAMLYYAPNNEGEKSLYKVDIFSFVREKIKLANIGKLDATGYEIINADILSDFLAGSLSRNTLGTRAIKESTGLDSDIFSFEYSVLSSALPLGNLSAILSDKEQLKSIIEDPSLTEDLVLLYTSLYNMQDSNFTSLSKLLSHVATEEFITMSNIEKVKSTCRFIAENKLVFEPIVKPRVKVETLVVEEIKPVEEKEEDKFIMTDDISSAVENPFAPSSTSNSFAEITGEKVEEIKAPIEVDTTEMYGQSVDEVIDVPEEQVTTVPSTDDTEVKDDFVMPDEELKSFGKPAASCIVVTNEDNVKKLHVWFDDKPEDYLLDLMKSYNFRFNVKDSIWVANYNYMANQLGNEVVKVYLSESDKDSLIRFTEPNKENLTNGLKDGGFESIISNAPVDETIKLKLTEAEYKNKMLQEEINRLKEENNKLSEECTAISNKFVKYQSDTKAIVEKLAEKDSTIKKLQQENESIRTIALSNTGEVVKVGQYDTAKKVIDAYSIRLAGVTVTLYQYSDGSIFISNSPVMGANISVTPHGNLYMFKVVASMYKALESKGTITVSDENLLNVVSNKFISHLEYIAQTSTNAMIELKNLLPELKDIDKKSQLGKTILAMSRVLSCYNEVQGLMK